MVKVSREQHQAFQQRIVCGNAFAGNFPFLFCLRVQSVAPVELPASRGRGIPAGHGTLARGGENYPNIMSRKAVRSLSIVAYAGYSGLPMK